MEILFRVLAEGRRHLWPIRDFPGFGKCKRKERWKKEQRAPLQFKRECLSFYVLGGAGRIAEIRSHFFPRFSSFPSLFHSF